MLWQALFDISMRKKVKSSKKSQSFSHTSKQRAAEEQTATVAVFNKSLLNEDNSSFHQEGSASTAVPVTVSDLKQFSYHLNHIIVVFLQQLQV